MYAIWTTKPEKYIVDILKQVEFDKQAFLFMTEAGFDSIKGLSSIEKDFDDPSWAATPGDFDLVNAFNGKVWTFTFKTPTGKTGTLRLPMPTQLVMFKVDIHDGSDQGNGPLLYKEIRFKGTVSSGSGFLGGSILNPTTYFLVFQGRGNGCDEVSDFRNFNLEITGKKANYQFYGKLKTGNGGALKER
ncbi:MAG: hypothetical protein ACJ72Z_05405 [Pyrinomonadaceae bacterium]